MANNYTEPSDYTLNNMVNIFNSIFLRGAAILFVSAFSMYPQNRLLQWPVLFENLDDKITSLFGESRTDHFHNGVDIASFNQPVVSIAAGQILYSSYAEDNPFANESGPGNTVWINHGKGIMSAYYHLKDGRTRGILQNRMVQPLETIGIAGNTGHSAGGHLHFVVADNFGKRIIDPLAVLPPVKDTMAPQIQSLMFHIGEKFTNVNDGDYINLSSSFPVTVRIRDAGEKKFQNRGIKFIHFILNGQDWKKASFDVISYKDGKWVNPQGLEFEQLYYKDDYLMGSPGLKSGENSVRVIARDYSGNTAERTFTFYVNRI